MSMVLSDIKQGILDGSVVFRAFGLLGKSKTVFSLWGLTVTYSGVYWIVLGYLLNGIGAFFKDGIYVKALDGSGQAKFEFFSMDSILKSWEALGDHSVWVKLARVTDALLLRLAAIALLVPMAIFCFNNYMMYYQKTADALLESDGKKVRSVKATEEGYAGIVWVLMFALSQVLDVGMPLLLGNVRGAVRTSLGGVGEVFIDSLGELSKWLGFAMAAFLNGFYSFDNNWRARGFDANKRFKLLASDFVYFSAFGVPLTLVCRYVGGEHGFLAGFGTFLGLFPIFICLAAASGHFGASKNKPIFFMSVILALAERMTGRRQASRSGGERVIIAEATPTPSRVTRSSSRSFVQSSRSRSRSRSRARR